MFEPGGTQETVFEDTKRLMQSVVDGYNVCIFAYGAWAQHLETSSTAQSLGWCTQSGGVYFGHTTHTTF